MPSTRRIPDYESLYAKLQANAPSMSGSPARLADVVMDLLRADDPPVRLLVGHSALQLVRQELSDQSAEIDRWAEVSDTDGDG